MTYQCVLCWPTLGRFAYSASVIGLHPCPCMDCSHFSQCSDFHQVSCGSFLLGKNTGMLVCHRASWDIMWAYHVATRVSGNVWVTDGPLILLLQHFLLKYFSQCNWLDVFDCTFGADSAVAGLSKISKSSKMIKNAHICFKIHSYVHIYGQYLPTIDNSNVLY